MKEKEKTGKTGNAGSNRKLIIACFCAVLFMIVVTAVFDVLRDKYRFTTKK